MLQLAIKSIELTRCPSLFLSRCCCLCLCSFKKHIWQQVVELFQRGPLCVDSVSPAEPAWCRCEHTIRKPSSNLPGAAVNTRSSNSAKCTRMSTPRGARLKTLIVNYVTFNCQPAVKVKPERKTIHLFTRKIVIHWLWHMPMEVERERERERDRDRDRDRHTETDTQRETERQTDRERQREEINRNRMTKDVYVYSSWFFWQQASMSSCIRNHSRF